MPATDPAGNAAPAGGFQNNGWYSGYNFYNGNFSSAAGDFAPGNPNGSGTVSSTVAAQTNSNNVPFLNTTRAQSGAAPLTTSGGNPSAGGGTGTGSGFSFGGAPATPNLQSIYDQYYTNNPDVATSNTNIKNLQTQITQRQQALDTATSNINDNPFYSEATRVGKIAQLNSDAQNDMNTLNQQLTTEQTNLSNYEAEAERQVNLAQGQYTINNQAWEQNMTEFNTLLSAGGIENASASTLATMSVSTGIPMDMLSSIQQSESAKNTQIVTSTDNAGNVTVVAVDATNGKVINSTSLGAIGAAKTTGGNTTKANDIATNYMQMQQDVINGADLKSLVSRYAVPGGLTAAQILQTYNNINTQPGGYGPAKENAADIKAGNYADQPGGLKTNVKGGSKYVAPL